MKVIYKLKLLIIICIWTYSVNKKSEIYLKQCVLQLSNIYE